MEGPTRDDAQLMVQLARLHAEAGIPRASRFVWSDDFPSSYQELKRRYPAGSEEQSYLHKMAGFYETVATLVKHGLFNEELLLDWLAVGTVWNRIGPHLLAFREEMGDPRQYENFEALAMRDRARLAKAA